MVWAKIDDTILDNPKIAKAGIFGFALHVAGITWCCRNLSDGKIPFARVTALLTCDRIRFDQSNPLALSDGPTSEGVSEGLSPYVVADHLVACGLWKRTAEGYEIHDFLVYNPSRREIEEKNAKAAERQDRARKSRRESRVTSRVTSSLPDPDPDLKKRERAREAPPLVESAEPEPETPEPTAGKWESVNATRDGAFGLAVAAWAEGIRSATGRPFSPPRGGSSELAKLVDCLLVHCPETAKRVDWARTEAHAFARGNRGKLSAHSFVDWCNTPPERRAGAEPGRQPFGASGPVPETPEAYRARMRAADEADAAIRRELAPAPTGALLAAVGAGPPPKRAKAPSVPPPSEAELSERRSRQLAELAGGAS